MQYEVVSPLFLGYWMTTNNKIQLRDVTEADLPILFEHQLDEQANRMAAFTAKDPSDREAFMARWEKILVNERTVNKVILLEGQVVGNISCFEMFVEQMIAYWIDRAYWGKGIATEALTQFLEAVPTRPLYARAVKDNIGSVRVLQKCGFEITGEDKGFANARGEEVEEYVLVLK
jgi:RimJ/RimL family protein N-acetyltransferase